MKTRDLKRGLLVRVTPNSQGSFSVYDVSDKSQTKTLLTSGSVNFYLDNARFEVVGGVPTIIGSFRGTVDKSHGAFGTKIVPSTQGFAKAGSGKLISNARMVAVFEDSLKVMIEND